MDFLGNIVSTATKVSEHFSDQDYQHLKQEISHEIDKLMKKELDALRHLSSSSEFGSIEQFNRDVQSCFRTIEEGAKLREKLASKSLLMDPK